MSRIKTCPKCGSETLNLVYIDKSIKNYHGHEYNNRDMFVDGYMVKQEFLQVDCQCCGYKWLMKTDETVMREEMEKMREVNRRMMQEQLDMITRQLSASSRKR